MTVETQTLVDLSDFIGLRFVCGKCNGKTSVSFPSESRFLSYPQGFTCPHCHLAWFEGPNDKRLEAIAVFLDRLAQLQTTKMPFHLQVEIAASGVEPQR